MIPKLKANSLYHKFYSELFQSDSDLSEELLISVLSKKLALICVEELIDNSAELSYMEEGSRSYWHEVRKEINKLWKNGIKNKTSEIDFHLEGDDLKLSNYLDAVNNKEFLLFIKDVIQKVADESIKITKN